MVECGKARSLRSDEKLPSVWWQISLPTPHTRALAMQ
jgi:hypothetical protein